MENPSDPQLSVSEETSGARVADETDVKKCLSDAEESKQEGNEYFRAKRWNEALNAYRSGLGRLPRAKGKEPNVMRDEPDSPIAGEPLNLSESNVDEGDTKVKASPYEGTEFQLSPWEIECAKARSILNANIGACYVKLGDHKDAVQACTDALADDPQYAKALQRRATSNEVIGSWSSLTSAQEDYNTLLKILPPTSPQIGGIKRSLETLKPRVEAAQKREMGEMVDKLKGLGNSILGNFGLSTDNFKFEPNGQGGYSMNFVK
ncbi:hypothetical protein JAAARDRAFT_203211 [Jaapia argillacea MUCL 33604]|uniref:Uncharacterized protein n=1 Tax=Jaapia argillacea MUCL 33604 TaxID=933084 RepID=A0A067QJX3_9AGAM|nr:hypothetical protein JAAARDRAFT_203211 [Jaapia argillacea MUCL 33604]